MRHAHTVSLFPRLFVIAGACLTILFVKLVQPTNDGAFVGFAAWLTLPLFCLFVTLLLFDRSGKQERRFLTLGIHVAAAGIVVGGVAFLTYMMFVAPPDAQGAIGVALTPLLQLVGIVILWVTLACVPGSE